MIAEKLVEAGTYYCVDTLMIVVVIKFARTCFVSFYAVLEVQWCSLFQIEPIT